jgi:hypothetical protein
MVGRSPFQTTNATYQFAAIVNLAHIPDSPSRDGGFEHVIANLMILGRSRFEPIVKQLDQSMANYTLTENRISVLKENCKRSSIIRKERLDRTISDYNKNPTQCTYCASALDYSKRHNRFCSKKCSVTFNNTARGPRTEDTKAKIKASIDLLHSAKPPKTIKRKEPKQSSMRVCSACEQPFIAKLNGRNTRKTCSAACASEARSKGGRRSAATRVLRSKDEIALYELCLSRFPDAQNNIILADGWDADISIPSLNLAILWNGIWHREQLSFKNHSLPQVQTRDRLKKKALTKAGWCVLVYEDNEYTPQSAFDNLVGLTGYDPISSAL